MLNKLRNFINNIKTGNKFLIGGFLLWLIATWLFGFNDTAESNLERIVDIVSLIFILQGILMNSFSMVHIHNNLHFDDKLLNELLKSYENK